MLWRIKQKVANKNAPTDIRYKELFSKHCSLRKHLESYSIQDIENDKRRWTKDFPCSAKGNKLAKEGY